MPEPLPPLYDGDFTPEQRALIAGFLLHWRRSFLVTQEQLSGTLSEDASAWLDGMRSYLHYSESVTRFLLGRLGYKVQKGEPVPEFEDVYDPFLSVIRRLVEGGYVDPAGMD